MTAARVRVQAPGSTPKTQPPAPRLSPPPAPPTPHAHTYTPPRTRGPPAPPRWHLLAALVLLKGMSVLACSDAVRPFIDGGHACDDELYARLPNVDAGVFRASKAAGSHEYIAQHGKRVGDAMGDTVHATHGQQICTTSQTEGDATKR